MAQLLSSMDSERDSMRSATDARLLEQTQIEGERRRAAEDRAAAAAARLEAAAAELQAARLRADELQAELDRERATPKPRDAAVQTRKRDEGTVTHMSVGTQCSFAAPEKKAEGEEAEPARPAAPEAEAAPPAAAAFRYVSPDPTAQAAIERLHFAVAGISEWLHFTDQQNCRLFEELQFLKCRVPARPPPSVPPSAFHAHAAAAAAAAAQAARLQGPPPAAVLGLPVAPAPPRAGE